MFVRILHDAKRLSARLPVCLQLFALFCSVGFHLFFGGLKNIMVFYSSSSFCFLVLWHPTTDWLAAKKELQVREKLILNRHVGSA